MKILVLNPGSKTTRNVMRDVIYGCWCKGKRVGGLNLPPISLLLVASVLKGCGHDVVFLDAGLEGWESFENIKKIRFDAVIISASVMTYKEDMFPLIELKKINDSIITVMYGPLPTFLPELALEKGVVDIIVRREPEFIIRDIFNALREGGQWQDVNGIGYRKDEGVVLNEWYPFIEDLDQIPFPDRGMLSGGIDYFNPVAKRVPMTTALTSRGCSARCIFCLSPSFFGQKVRSRSAENVIHELKLISSQGYKEVFFRDETFTMFRERNIRICEEIIKEKIDLTWVCNSRVGMLDKEMMRLMKAAGCHMVKFGVESGSQKILDNIKKGTTIEQAVESFRLSREVGLSTHAHFMLGNPGDTRETVEETINFALSLQPTTATFGISTPFPGTELYHQVTQRYSEINYQQQAREHVSGFYASCYCNLSKEELENSLRRAYQRFYMRPGYILGWLGRIRSILELQRVIMSGIQVLEFGSGKEKDTVDME